LPTSSLYQAAGHFARHAAPTTRSLALVAASLILTACGDGSLFSSSLGEPTSVPPPASLAGPTSEPPPTSPGTATDNYAPSISGTPQPTATVNQPYSFKPEAYDPDGDVLTFQISKLPPWATFSPATGEITGMPPTGWTGTVTDIRISVTDGEANAALPAFSITVADSATSPGPATSSATLSWTVPSQNDDGSPLTDLAGYRIYYGMDSGDLNQRLDITSPATTSIEIAALSSGVWYFTMTSVNGAGTESLRTGAATISL